MNFLWPLALCWLAGAVLLALDGRRAWVGAAAAAVLALALALDLWLLPQLAGGRVLEVVTGGWPTGVGIRLRADALAAVFAAVTSAVLLLVLVHELLAGVGSRAFPALIMLLAAGMHGIFFTGDAFNFYVFFELSMAAAFLLAGYGWGCPELRATFIFVVVNLIGSVIFLGGVASLYQIVGTLDLGEIGRRAAAAQTSLALPGSLLLAAFALKLGLFPFHHWAPVVYRDTRPAVAAILAGALVNIGTYGMLRLGYGVLESELAQARLPLLVLGAVSALYGSLLAYGRRVTGEIIAYASIAQAGYFFIALGVGGRAGASAAILLTLAASLDKATAFLALGVRGRGAALALGVGAVSLAGIPLTIGFVSKLELIRASLGAGGALVLVAVLLAAGAVTMAATARAWHLHVAGAGARLGQGRQCLAVLALAALVVGFGAAPAPLLSVVDTAVDNLAGQRQ